MANSKTLTGEPVESNQLLSIFPGMLCAIAVMYDLVTISISNLDIVYPVSGVDPRVYDIKQVRRTRKSVREGVYMGMPDGIKLKRPNTEKYSDFIKDFIEGGIKQETLIYFIPKFYNLFFL